MQNFVWNWKGANNWNGILKARSHFLLRPGGGGAEQANPEFVIHMFLEWYLQNFPGEKGLYMPHADFQYFCSKGVIALVLSHPMYHFYYYNQLMQFATQCLPYLDNNSRDGGYA